MRKKIRDLDFDLIVAEIARATDPVRRVVCDGTIQNSLKFVHSSADAVRLLRNHVMLASLEYAKTLDDVQFDQPLVQALVHVQHHPLAQAIPTVRVEEGLRGPNAGLRLTEIAAAHPELRWDADKTKALIIRAIREGFGDHELDDAQPPWDMYWSPASSAASALIVLITLCTLGDL